MPQCNGHMARYGDTWQCYADARWIVLHRDENSTVQHKLACAQHLHQVALSITATGTDFVQLNPISKEN